jgi:hypothetical protein
MKKNIAVLGATAVSALLIPLAVFAQVSPAGTCTGSIAAGIETVICQIYRIIKIAIPVLILGAVAYFIYGVVMFVIAGDAEEKGNARSVMIHGIIGFAVIVGLWGLVNILLGTFNLNPSTAAPVIPVFQ